MKANERQVGGDHYKIVGEEHWDRVWRLWGRGYFVGQITKYLERYPQKNGLDDLKKAQHFLEKLIELESTPWTPALFETWEKINKPLWSQPTSSLGDGSEPEWGYTNQDPTCGEYEPGLNTDRCATCGHTRSEHTR